MPFRKTAEELTQWGTQCKRCISSSLSQTVRQALSLCYFIDKKHSLCHCLAKQSFPKVSCAVVLGVSYVPAMTEERQAPTPATWRPPSSGAEMSQMLRKHYYDQFRMRILLSTPLRLLINLQLTDYIFTSLLKQKLNKNHIILKVEGKYHRKNKTIQNIGLAVS